MSKPLHKAVFLDRDGTVIPDANYLATVEGVTLLPGAGEALAALARAGFLLVLVTNQSGIGRGYFTAAIVEAQHHRLQELLKPFGVTLAAVEFCPHAPDTECNCRKPKPGMLLTAAAKLQVAPADSFMVGDKPADVEAGRAAGCRTVFIGPQACAAADFSSATLAAAAEWILTQTPVPS